ncbi:MAG: asparagine synthase C-terminal domain-containing protein [ANME-2 cluster archaeon]|nr:asparagine synthase C-terminal domain-containing protein [ANME-2 cluster archaeon]
MAAGRSCHGHRGIEMDAHFQTIVRATGNHDEPALCEMIVQSLSVSVSKSLRPHCAVLFSGGVDSSLIAVLAARQIPDIMLITVGFSDSNDIGWAPVAAQLLGFGNNHHSKIITPRDVQSTIPRVMKVLGTADPMTISLAVPLFIACVEAKSMNIGLLLAGQGADELFGGYHRYQDIAHEGMSALDEAIAADVSGLPRRDILRDTTIAKAANVELAVPFLEPGMVQLGMSIPAMLKVREFEGKPVGKYILRRAAEQVMPGEIAWRDKKAMQYGSGVWAAMGKLARQAGYRKQDKGYIRKYLYSVAEENRITLDVTS